MPPRRAAFNRDERPRGHRAVLFPAIIFQYTLFRWVTHKDEGKRPMLLGWAVSLVSLTLWFGVGVGGRAIGFV